MSVTIRNVPELIERQRQAAQATGFAVEVLLETESGPLLGMAKGDSGPVIYVSTGMHGDEPAGPLAVTELLEEGFFAEGVRWILCPVLNPRGLALGMRETPESVDMNRDYLQKSTDEVKAHVEWMERQELPGMFLSLHEDWESTGIYLYEINILDISSKAEDLLDAAAPYFDREPELVIDDHEVTERGWIYHSSEPDIPEGWPEAIYIAKRGCRCSYTIETPSSAELRKRIDCHKAVVREAVRV